MMNNRPQHSGRFGAAIRMPAAPDAEPVYRTGDTVMHPSEGVCRVAELRRMALSGMQARARGQEALGGDGGVRLPRAGRAAVLKHDFS